MAGEPEEGDHMIFVTTAQYEMRCGKPEIAVTKHCTLTADCVHALHQIIYLDLAISTRPEDEQPYIVRSQAGIRKKFVQWWKTNIFILLVSIVVNNFSYSCSVP